MSATSALADLLAINNRIGPAESEADGEWFDAVLHEQFVMRRPGGALSTKEEFISGLATGAQRSTTMQAIELHGQFRATARCRVDKWAVTDPGIVASFDNLRVFVFEAGRWQLIAWLTEPA